MLYVERDIFIKEELTWDYILMPRNTSAKDKDDNITDCLCGSRICHKPKFKRYLEPKRHIKPKRHVKPSTNRSDLRVQSVQSLIQSSPEHKQTSCETAGPGEVSGVEDGISTDKKWCRCGEKDDGDWMVKCSEENCPYQWFHFRYVGLTTEPEREKWYCELCAHMFFHSDCDE
jgi:hypothetical protein